MYLDGVSVDSTTEGRLSHIAGADLNDLGGVLVDSGTTLVYLPEAAADRVAAAVRSVAGADVVTEDFFQMGDCVSAEDLEAFPTVTLELSGYDLELTPTQYLLDFGGCYYWGVASSDVGIIGNIALKDRTVVFDREANRVGFADADCGAVADDAGVAADADDAGASADDAGAAGAAGDAGAAASPDAGAVSEEAYAATALAAVGPGGRFAIGGVAALAAGAAAVAGVAVARKRRRGYEWVPSGETVV